MWGLPRFLQREHVDVFHGTDFAVPYLPLRPSVLTLHDLSPWTQAWQPDAGRVRQRTPLLLRSGIATMVITPSEAVRREAIERFRLAPDRVVATQLAASDQFRPTPVDDPAKPYFLFVGTLEPRKNLARLIEAWRVVRNAGHDVDLKIAGRTRADFHTPSPEPGLQLLGAVPDVDLPGLYSNALAVVYPSLYEGFGLPVLEAMQCGALVITSRDPAILEVTGGAEQALHVNVRTDADATRVLAQAMLEVAASLRTGSGGFREMKERALHRAEGFTWEKTAERTREVYDEARRVFSYS
jgi:glycosyltransferase involved in cell wall biosynthesis